MHFTRNQAISIVVGQRGTNASRSGYGGGGGGGSFVYRDILYAAAGGAGGQESSYKSSCQVSQTVHVNDVNSCY